MAASPGNKYPISTVIGVLHSPLDPVFDLHYRGRVRHPRSFHTSALFPAIASLLTAGLIPSEVIVI